MKETDRQTQRHTHTHTHLQVGMVRSLTECKSFRRQVYVRLSSTVRMSEDYGARKPRFDTEHNLRKKFMILQLRLVVLLTRGQWCACACACVHVCMRMCVCVCACACACVCERETERERERETRQKDREREREKERESIETMMLNDATIGPNNY